jgi:hypothetical protein
MSLDSSLCSGWSSLEADEWGIMHLVKTAPVVAGFEPLSDDNRHVLRMEWILEGVTLLFLAVLVSVFTLWPGPDALASRIVFGLSALLLLVMAAVSLFTGAKASPLPYKLCAPIFTSAAALILFGGFAT